MKNMMPFKILFCHTFLSWKINTYAYKLFQPAPSMVLYSSSRSPEFDLKIKIFRSGGNKIKYRTETLQKGPGQEGCSTAWPMEWAHVLEGKLVLANDRAEPHSCSCPRSLLCPGPSSALILAVCGTGIQAGKLLLLRIKVWKPIYPSKK